MQNEKLAELCAAQPDRFVAFATVALQHPDLAVQQLEEGVKKLGLRGVSVGGNVNGEELADPKFHPVWAKAEELGCLVFIHPVRVPELDRRLAGNGELTNIIGVSARHHDRALAPDLRRARSTAFPGSRSAHPTAAAICGSYAAAIGRRLRKLSASAVPARRSRKSPPSICGSSTTIRSCSRPKRCGI